MQKNMWLACKYLRLSIDDGDKEESESIVNQAILIDSYFKSTEDMAIIETFKDDGYTGTDFNRPGFQAMMKEIEKKSINCIIVKDLSRFGRDHIEVDRYIQKVFPQMGVRFIAINDNYDSLTANMTDTHLVVPVKTLVNETYSRENSKKIRSHLEAKRSVGQYVGAFVAYGYRKNKEDKNIIEIDPYAARNVKRIFEWKKDGLSNQQIADKLNDQGILAPADYKKSAGIRFKSSFQTHLSSKWSPVTIGRILKNPIYCGTLEQGKTKRVNYKVKIQREVPEEDRSIIENHHEAIIEKATFDMVQNLNRRDTRIAPGEEKVYLFGGLLICGDCGRNLIRRTTSYKGKKSIYYICTTYNRKDGCSRHSIRESSLLDLVNDGLQLYGKMTDAIREAVDYLKCNQIDTGELIRNDSTVTYLRKELDKYYKLLSSLAGNLAKGILSKEDYLTLKESYQSKINEIENNINGQETYIEDLLENKFLSDRWMKEFLAKPELGDLDRDMLIHYIEKIIVYEDKKIEIVYRFQDEMMIAARIADSIKSRQEVDV